jgi:hypothetical protein
MAQYQVRGPGGRLYDVEAPTDATDAQIIGALRQRLAEETAPTTSAPPQEETDSLASYFEKYGREEEAGFGENILSGLSAGAVGLFETAALGAATLLDEGNETAARKVIQEAADAITPEGGDKESTTYKLAQGVGSILGFIPTVLLGPAALPAAAALGVGAAAGEASERAREAGATEEERSTAALMAAPVGLLEVTPLGRIAKALKMPVVGDTIDNLSDTVVGGITDRIGAGAMREISDRVGNAAATGGLEAAQEAAAEIAQNLIQQGVYDPTQDTFGGVGEALAIGGGAGAIVQALVDTFAGRRARTPESERQAPTEAETEVLGLPAPQAQLPGGTGFQPQTLPDGSVANTPEELAAYQRAQQERAVPKLPAPQTEEELIAEGNFEEVARRRALAERRQGDLFGQEQQPPTRLTSQEEQELDALGAELGLTQEQIDEFKARQGELFEGQAPSPQAVPRLEGPPSEQELVSQGDFEAIARRREQEAVEAGRRKRVEQEAEATRRAQAVEQAQRAEAEQVQRDRQLAEAGRPMVEEQARRRIGDEQEMFPLERERAQAESTRPTEQRARYIDQQQELEGVETRPEAEARRQREEQGELFGPRGGVPRRATAPVPSPRATVPESTQRAQQELFPPREPEQAEIFGPRGGVRRQPPKETDIARGRTASASRDVETEPKVVTKKVMADLGIPTAAPVRKRVEGRDMSIPEDARFVRTQLTEFANNLNVTEGTKFKITKFLEGTPDGQMEMFDARQRVRSEAQAPTPQQVEEQADVEPRQPEPETSRASVQASEPSPRRRQAEPEPERAARATTPEPTRLEDTERDTTDVVDRERDERGALEEAPAKPKRKVTRRKTAETIQAVKPLPKAKTTRKPKADTEAPAPAESTTTRKDVTVKDTTVAGATLDKFGQVDAGRKDVEKTKEKTTSQRTPMRVATEADQKLREAQTSRYRRKDDKKGEPPTGDLKVPLLGITKDGEEVGKNFFEAQSKRIKSVATDADKTKIALLFDNVNDPLHSGKSKTSDAALLDVTTTGENRNINAARMYFGKKARIEDVVELIAFDTAFGAEGQGSYQATTAKSAGKDSDIFKALDDTTSELEAEVFRGLGNLRAARAAQSYVLGAMSPKVKALMLKRAKRYADMALVLDANETRRIALEEPESGAARIYRNKLAAKERQRRIEQREKQRKRQLQLEEIADTEAELTAIEEQKRREAEAETTVEGKVAEAEAEDKVDVVGDGDFITFDELDGEAASINAALDVINDLLNLPKNAVGASSVPIHPAVIIALQDGNLPLALMRIASTTQNNQVRNAVTKLAEVVGTTKVEVVENLEEAGNFDPKTNTIRLDAEAGMNVHTVLHEMTHAAVSATLANKSHPVTKQLTKLFESVKDKLDTAYGATNLDEFVSEAMSNPEFRTKLASIAPKGDTFSALDRFTSAVMNFLRRLFGASTKPVSDGTVDRKLSELDRMIENIMAPAPESRNADILPLTKGGPKEVAEFANGVATSVNRSSRAIRDAVSRDGFATSVVNFLKSAGGPNSDKLRRGALMTLPSQALFVDVLGKLKITEGARMHELLEEQEGAINIANKQLDATLNAIIKWQKGNKNNRKAFDDVVYESTLAKIDPTKSIDKYKGRETEYRAIKSLYDQLDAEGKALYVELRDSYKRQYEKLKDVINRRIDGMVNEDTGKPITEAERKTLKEKVFGKLLEQGRIEPYFR